MSEVAHYSAFETLRDGRRIEIRALRPDDRAALIAAVDRSSGEVLPDNIPMLKVFEMSGFPMSRKHDFQAIHVSLRLR